MVKFATLVYAKDGPQAPGGAVIVVVVSWMEWMDSLKVFATMVTPVAKLNNE